MGFLLLVALQLNSHAIIHVPSPKIRCVCPPYSFIPLAVPNALMGISSSFSQLPSQDQLGRVLRAEQSYFCLLRLLITSIKKFPPLSLSVFHDLSQSIKMNKFLLLGFSALLFYAVGKYQILKEKNSRGGEGLDKFI